MKKRFNDYWAPKEFQSYMSRLEDEVRKLKIGANYKELSQTLIYLWRKESDLRRKDDIRNYLVLVNIKLAHELLFKKLNPDVSQSDAIDIVQEINLGLVEEVTRFLEKKENPEFFSIIIWNRLCGKLQEIIKTYYEAKDFEQVNSIFIEEFEDSRNNIEEIIEKNYKEVISSRCLRRYCTNRDEEILKMVYGIQCNSYNLEEIGYKFGLTRERIRQIESKSLEKIRSKYSDSLIDPIGYTGYTFYPDNENNQCRAKKESSPVIDKVLGNLVRKYNKKYLYYVSSSYPIKLLLDKGVNPKYILVIGSEAYKSRITPYHFVFNIEYIQDYKMNGLILKSIEGDKFSKVNLFQEVFPMMPYGISERQILEVQKTIMNDRTILYRYFDRECLDNWKPCKEVRGSYKYCELDESSSMKILAKLILLRNYVES